MYKIKLSIAIILFGLYSLNAQTKNKQEPQFDGI